jgi:predicted nuclease of predicted toxin-antitoxin system
MNFLADECVDGQIVDRLRSDGHAVGVVAEPDQGMSDEPVLRRSNESGSVLITADKDFGELVFRQGRAFSGVLLLRLAGKHPDQKAEMVSATVRTHEAELEGNFSVLTARTLRVRRKS